MKKMILIIVGVLVIGGVIFSFYKFSKNGKLSTVELGVTETVDETEPIEEVVPPEIKKVDSSINTYVHKKYNFTFNFPSEYKTSNFNEGAGEQILFNASKGDWFQIYITPWDEGEIVTPERVKKDLPDIVIKEPQQVILGPTQKDGVGPHALIFFSKDSSLGETREIWFVENGSLYQITTYKRLDAVIGNVLSTLVFN